MSFEEKNAWIYAIVTVASYLAYLGVLWSRAQGTQMADVAYVGPMLWTIGAAVVASVVGHVGVVVSAPAQADRTDERDVVIRRYGDVVGLWSVSVGVLVALGLTMAQLAHFWIANMIYLAFVIAALISTAVRLLAYRRGFRPW